MIVVGPWGHGAGSVAGIHVVAVGEVKKLPHKWTNITIHITKVAICCVHG